MVKVPLLDIVADVNAVREATLTHKSEIKTLPVLARAPIEERKVRRWMTFCMISKNRGAIIGDYITLILMIAR
jgi:hypothetical protein